jgi:hypothetical protein
VSSNDIWQSERIPFPLLPMSADLSVKNSINIKLYVLLKLSNKVNEFPIIQQRYIGI